MKKYLVAMFGVFVGVIHAQESPRIGTGPFGLPMGATATQLGEWGATEEADSKGYYSLKRVPKPHDAFEGYVLTISPTLGLCRIAAIGKSIASSSQGYELKSAFDNLEQALMEKYGNRKRFDFLNAGSIWSDANDFMMGIVKKERNLESFWDKDEGSHLTDHITSIELEAKALRSDTGYLALTYEFENSKACLEEIKKRANSSL